MLELRYNPDEAMATWHGSRSAVRAMNEADRAIPFPKPPGIIYRDSRKDVLPCHLNSMSVYEVVDAIAPRTEINL